MIYTRTGDAGTTSLVGGQRIDKDDIRLEAYGTIDELSSLLGLLISLLDHTAEQHDIHLLTSIQNILFRIGGHLATDRQTTPLYPSCQMPVGQTEILEKEIDDITALLKSSSSQPAAAFILPGGSKEAALCHVARAVSRRAERRITQLSRHADIDEEILRWTNRLSDYLFMLAKKINFNRGVSEILWQKDC